MSGTPLMTASLPAPVRLVENGKLPRLDISARHATAQVYFHGAHLTVWRPSHTDAPVLWSSAQSFFQPDKPIRGGAPICFPWFGAHPTDSRAPAHGFARLSEWTLTEAHESADGAVTLAFSLQGDGASPAWPHRFLVTSRITIGSRLMMTLMVHNPTDQPFTFEAALHTYFAVHDIGEVTISGLENTYYLDKVAGFIRRRQEDEPIRFSAETDRVYLDTPGTSVIHDPGLQRRIIVSSRGSRSTVVWNPWIEKARAMPDFGDLEWREMVCVETANVGAAAVRVDPGHTHTMTADIGVERLQQQ